MIHVDRPKPPPAAVMQALSKRSGNGLTELEWALWHFEGVVPQINPLPGKPDTEPEFGVYGEISVKTALNHLFDKRCAYCESRYDHVAPMDVEHYRPKGAVIEANGKRTKPGYYWLAADWDNLLPSCIGCNRKRCQAEVLPDGTVVESALGKGNLFPLHDCKRASKQGEEKDEDPLLLNPCLDDPEPHLVFTIEGLVEPRATQEERDKPRGMATIETCGLWREALIESRKRAGTHLRDAMAAVIASDNACRLLPGHPLLETNRLRHEDALAHQFDDIDYRALSQEVRALFENAREAINDYFGAEADWVADQSEATRQVFVAATTTIKAFYATSGLHQKLLLELFGLAGIPVEYLK